jgi:hypothetical protein
MLGVKVPKSTHNLGEKISKASYSLGNRYYSNVAKSFKNHISTDSKEGIDNHGNSTSQHHEPKTFNHVPTPRNYTTNITHSTIEKQRREKPKEKFDKFI